MAITKQTSLFHTLLEQGVLKVGAALDLGSGKGGDARNFAKAGFRVTAVESAIENVEHLRAKSEQEGANVTVVQSDISHFDMGDSAFDLVSAQYVLHFFPKEVTKEIISKMVRASNSGGVIIFTLLGPKDDWRETWSIWESQEAMDFFDTLPVHVRNMNKEEGYNQAKSGKSKYWDITTYVLIKK